MAAALGAHILNPPTLQLQKSKAAGAFERCRIGARVAHGGRIQQLLSWKKREKNGTAKTCLGLVSGGLAAGVPANGTARAMTGRKPRGHEYEDEMEVIPAEGKDAARSLKLNSLDRVEESLLLTTRSEIVRPDTFTLEDYFSVSVKKAVEFAADLFQQLFLTRLIERDQFSTFVKLSVIGCVIGLQACSPVWGAGTELAKSNVDSGFFSNWDDVQSGFASSFLLIFFSEIGDKTFFIAALLATRKPGAAVFSGTFGALAVMTVISVVLGRAFHYIDELLPSFGNTKIPWDDLAAVILLVYFGVSTLIEAANMEESKQEEEQQEAELAIAGVGANGAIAGTVAATFALVFVAEWGDKSFFSTIALAAASSPLGVVTGAVAGHGAATLLAVLGGSFLGNYVSEKVIAYLGGALFLVFAGVTLVETLS
ncbi:hypothetical protein R1flu_003890 [Riccia fluitans]|uniref:GDT1 family protein n=1 Tax=Riccia fluitans TaxID=41844 RepID=A0ABD1YAF6_9MARC